MQGELNMEVIGHQSKPIENPQKYITECKCGAIIGFTRNDMHSNHISMSYDIKDKEPLFIQCPECHNTIELDWNCCDEEEEEGCSGHCSHCSSECVAEDEEEYKLDDSENDDDEDM